MTDPSLAPEGCDAFYVLSPVPHLDSGTDWSTEAETYRKKIERRLEGTVLPDLSKHIVTSRLLTPQDFQTRLLSYKGAAFSLQRNFFKARGFVRTTNQKRSKGFISLAPEHIRVQDCPA